MANREFTIADEVHYNRRGPIRWIISHVLRYKGYLAIFIVGTLGLNFALFIAAMVGTEFGLGAGAFGLMNSIMAIGSVAGALLSGLCDVAERVLECPARIGLAQGYMQWPEELNHPAWTTAAGLAMYSARLRTQVDLEKQSVGVLGRILR